MPGSQQAQIPQHPQGFRRFVLNKTAKTTTATNKSNPPAALPTMRPTGANQVSTSGRRGVVLRNGSSQ